MLSTSSAVNSSSSSSSSSASGEGALKSRHDPGHGAADCANVDSRLGCFFTAAVPHASDPHKEAVKARGRVVAAGLGFLASAFPARPRRGGLFAVCPPPARPAGQRGASPSRLPQREQRFGPRRPERSAPHGDPLRKSHVAKGVSRLRPGPRWSMSPSRSQRPRHAAPVSRRPRPSPPGLPRRGAAADAPLSPPRALWTERRRRASPPRSRCARGVTWSGWERRGLASREQRSAGRTIAPAHSNTRATARERPRSRLRHVGAGAGAGRGGAAGGGGGGSMPCHRGGPNRSISGFSRRKDSPDAAAGGAQATLPPDAKNTTCATRTYGRTVSKKSGQKPRG